MRFDLSDEEWALLEPLLPKSSKSARVDDRKIVNAIFYVLLTGSEKWVLLSIQYNKLPLLGIEVLFREIECFLLRKIFATKYVDVGTVIHFIEVNRYGRRFDKLVCRVSHNPPVR
jgi:hypothetical protein